MSFLGSDPMFTLMFIIGIAVFVGFGTMLIIMFQMNRKLKTANEHTKVISISLTEPTTGKYFVISKRDISEGQLARSGHMFLDSAEPPVTEPSDPMATDEMQ